jgi:NAD(P)-dependent dehydrogenase (short-subunit alcohol dehydrogenase family)
MVVVRNAGYGLMGAAEELTDEQVRHQIDTNLVGSIQLIRAALPHLRAQAAWRGASLPDGGDPDAGAGYRLRAQTIRGGGEPMPTLAVVPLL